MQKTTAKVEHRDYIPRGWIAIEFCRVNFYGFRAEEMEIKWNKIKSERYDRYNSIYNETENQIRFWRNEANIIFNQVKKSKPFYRFWYNKKEKELLARANEYLRRAYKSEEEKRKSNEKRLFDVYECHTQIENLLKQNGFVLTQTSSSGNECVTKTEIWTLEE